MKRVFRLIAGGVGATAAVGMTCLQPASASPSVFQVQHTPLGTPVAIASPAQDEVFVAEKVGSGAIVEHYASKAWTQIALPPDASTQISSADPGEFWTAQLDATGKPVAAYHYTNGTWTTVHFPSTVTFGGDTTAAQPQGVYDVRGAGAVMSVTSSVGSSEPPGTTLFRVTDSSATDISGVLDGITTIGTRQGVLLVENEPRGSVTEWLTLDESSNTLTQIAFSGWSLPWAALSSPDEGVIKGFNPPKGTAAVCWRWVRGKTVQIDDPTVACPKVALWMPTTDYQTVTDEPGTHNAWLYRSDATGAWLVGRVALDNVPDALNTDPVVNPPTKPAKLPVDAKASTRGSGRVSTSLKASGKDLVLAFVAMDGPVGRAQSSTVSGGGLTWHLVRRANAQTGATEVWQASTTAAKSVKVTAAPKFGTHTSLVLVAVKNAKVGASSATSAPNGAAHAYLTATADRSWTLAAGEDPNRAARRSVAPNEPMLYQTTDSGIRNTAWVQSAALGAAKGERVEMRVSGPAGAWNYVAVEVVPAS